MSPRRLEQPSSSHGDRHASSHGDRHDPSAIFDVGRHRASTRERGSGRGQGEEGGTLERDETVAEWQVRPFTSTGSVHGERGFLGYGTTYVTGDKEITASVLAARGAAGGRALHTPDATGETAAQRGLEAMNTPDATGETAAQRGGKEGVKVLHRPDATGETAAQRGGKEGVKALHRPDAKTGKTPAQRGRDTAAKHWEDRRAERAFGEFIDPDAYA